MTEDNTGHPPLRIASLAIDCADPPALARWWAALLGAQIEIDDEGDASIWAPPGPGIDFLRVPEGKSVKNRLHLDLRGRDFDEAVQTALTLGATRADDVYNGGSWQVMRDPEGNEFCILRTPYAD